VNTDRKYQISSRPPGFRSPDFLQANVGAAAFLQVWQASILSCSELTGLASKLSPLARRIVRWAVKEREAALAHHLGDRGGSEHADALLHRTMLEQRSGHG
jgi:hypothetical protein